RTGNYATAIPIYRSLAEKGDVSARIRLGFLYESGAGLKRDWVWRHREGASAPPIIYELVEKAAKSGFAVAQFSLGVMNYPIGDPSFDAARGNPSRALVWHRRAAEQGDFGAELLLDWPMPRGLALFKIMSRLINGTTSRHLEPIPRTNWP